MDNNETEVDFMEIYVEYLKRALNIETQEKVLAIARHDYAEQEIERLKEEIKQLKEK